VLEVRIYEFEIHREDGRLRRIVTCRVPAESDRRMTSKCCILPRNVTLSLVGSAGKGVFRPYASSPRN